ncbi:small integral membrane protein 14 isoform X2 [Phymastichus coffea]|nr:small integral membrane protein 14 isoform X2 [Phymastichus coffea]
MSGFDLCACLNGNDLMIQRLLSILRQSQEYCTDNECLTPPSLPASPNAQVESGDFMVVCLMMIFGMLLYVLRPNSLRQSSGGKGRNNDADTDGEPPLPPSSVN